MESGMDRAAIEKELERASAEVGKCQTCWNLETDGEYGEIENCVAHAPDEAYEKLLSMAREGRCPMWKPLYASVFCEEHNTLDMFSPIGCTRCFDEEVRRESEGKEMNK